MNNIIDEMKLTDIYRTFHPSANKHFFSIVYGTFSRKDHMLFQKQVLANLIRSKSSISDHSYIKLEINKKKTEKPMRM